MNKTFWLATFAEILWWLLILVFCGVVILPLHGIIAFQFLKILFALAFVFAAGFRMVIFTNQTVYLKPAPLKMIFVLAIPVAVYFILQNVQHVTLLFDTQDIYRFLENGNLAVTTSAINSKYHLFKNEFVLFSVGSLIVLFLLELRLLAQLAMLLKKIE